MVRWALVIFFVFSQFAYADCPANQCAECAPSINGCDIPGGWCIKREDISLTYEKVSDCTYTVTAKIKYKRCMEANVQPAPYARVFLDVVRKESGNGYASGDNDLGKFNPNAENQGAKLAGPKLINTVELVTEDPPIRDEMTYRTKAPISLSDKTEQGKSYFLELTLKSVDGNGAPFQIKGRARKSLPDCGPGQCCPDGWPLNSIYGCSGYPPLQNPAYTDWPYTNYGLDPQQWAQFSLPCARFYANHAYYHYRGHGCSEDMVGADGRPCEDQELSGLTTYCCPDGWPVDVDGRCNKVPAGCNDLPLEQVTYNGTYRGPGLMTMVPKIPGCATQCMRNPSLIVRHNYFMPGDTRWVYRREPCGDFMQWECISFPTSSVGASSLASGAYNSLGASIFSPAPEIYDMAKDYLNKNHLLPLGGLVQLPGGAQGSNLANTFNEPEAFYLGDYSMLPYRNPSTGAMHDIGTPVLFKLTDKKWEPVLHQKLDKKANVIKAIIEPNVAYQVFSAELDNTEMLVLGDGRMEPSSVIEGEECRVMVEVVSKAAEISLQIMGLDNSVIHSANTNVADETPRAQVRVPMYFPIPSSRFKLGYYRGVISATDKTTGQRVERWFVFDVVKQKTDTGILPNSEEAEFAIGEVYVYPNPIQPGNNPALHVDSAQQDQLSTRIYDVSGDLVYEIESLSSPEFPLDVQNLKSGVYTGILTAKRAGKDEIRKRYRFSVVK